MTDKIKINNLQKLPKLKFNKIGSLSLIKKSNINALDNDDTS